MPMLQKDGKAHGKLTNLRLEAYPPAGMLSRGWPRQALLCQLMQESCSLLSGKGLACTFTPVRIAGQIYVLRPLSGLSTNGEPCTSASDNQAVLEAQGMRVDSMCAMSRGSAP
eukprot:6302813-Amphidinium_carterae.1